MLRKEEGEVEEEYFHRTCLKKKSLYILYAYKKRGEMLQSCYLYIDISLSHSIYIFVIFMISSGEIQRRG